MTDTAWRLVWALPLVLLTGTAAMLVLKRILTPSRPPVAPGRRMALCESLAVSDGTRLHLIELDQQRYLLVESATQTVLQSVPSHTDLARHRPSPGGPPWAQRLARSLLR